MSSYLGLYYVRVDSHSILVSHKILQLMSWWIFYIEIPYNTWLWRTWISEPSFILSGLEVRWQRTIVAFSKLRHFSWDSFPANTITYDSDQSYLPDKLEIVTLRHGFIERLKNNGECQQRQVSQLTSHMIQMTSHAQVFLCRWSNMGDWRESL